MKLSFTCLLCILLLPVKANLPAYQLFDSEGNKKAFSDLIEVTSKADMVFFGELHNNPVAHWLRQELLDTLNQISEHSVIIGAEMFEADNQIILDEYLQGFIQSRHFESQARLWPNYVTDYKPLLEFAKNQNIPVIATNVPRRYASMVAFNGKSYLDTLSDQAKKYIVPLPFEVNMELESYQNMLEMAGDHGSENMVQAQALKDATMAHFILKNYQKEENLFFHLNGSYHSNYKEGIVWYIKQQMPDVTIVNLATVEQTGINTLNEAHADKGDFILVIPQNMIKTH